MTSTTFRPMALAIAVGALAILGAEPPPGQPSKNPPNGAKTPAAKPAATNSAPGQASKGSPDAKKSPATKSAEADQELQVKAIKLSNVSPEEVRETLTAIWPALMTSRGIPASGAGAAAQVAVNQRTKTLFVRGTDKQLEMVENLIKILDTAPGKEPPSGNGLNIVRLRHAKVEEVLQVLAGLGMQQQVIPLPKMNALILPQSERQANDVHLVIENVDTEGKTKKTASSSPSVKK